jgi:hypothetical protein
MIFTFWDGDRSDLADFIADWQMSVAEPVVHDDAAVLNCLDAINRDWLSIYRRIRIPACKADIARLTLLYSLGGLYVDAHTGNPNAKLLARLFAQLATKELIVTVKPVSDGNYHLVNGAVCARARCQIVLDILSKCMANLAAHLDREQQADDYLPYNIAALVGAWVPRMHLFVPVKDRLALTDEFVDRVGTIIAGKPPDQPFYFYRHCGYRNASAHWSERQKKERLFAQYNGND